MKPCVEFLGFDDRWLMRLGIPLLSIPMPVLLNLNYTSWQEYWFHFVPESMVFVFGFWIFYRYVIIYLHKRFPKLSQAHTRVTSEILVIVLSAPIIKWILSSIIAIILKFCYLDETVMPSHLQTLLNIYLPSGLIVALYEAFYYFSKYKESLLEKEKLEKVHIQTQLDNLRNQINPHFLFNSLNTLMNLIPTDQDAAMDYLSKLSKFYRFSVGAQEEVKVPINQEIACAKLYAELLSVRFREGINYKFDLPQQSDKFLLPLSLQLLIENAVKHNIVSRNQPLSITIEYSDQDDYITVKNNLQKKLEAVSSTGMGLKNIIERYAYFTDKEIKCESNQDEFKVSIPLLKQ